MKPETIRKIDIRIGKAACFALTCLRRCLDVFPSRRGSPGPVKKILFIKLIEQGATVLASDAIQRGREMVGREGVFFLVFEENREILKIMDLVPRENILTIRNESLFTFLGDLAKRLLEIRRLEIDAAVDMEFFARASAIISFLSGARRRVGLHRFTSELPYRGDLMTHRVQYNPYLHTSRAYSLLVEALSRPSGEIPLLKKPVEKEGRPLPRFRPAGEELERMDELIAGEGLDIKERRPLVLLNPNASDMLPLRKWPMENFVALGKAILRDYPRAGLIITGGSAERDAAGDLCRKLESLRAASLAGKTTLRELLTLYTLADLLVTNDSGPAHFASLTDIGCLVLYGPETPKLFGALGANSYPLYAGLACSPCVNAFNHRFSPCTDNQCMKSISPDEVMAKIRECPGA